VHSQVENTLTATFADTKTHQVICKMIENRSTNPVDVREMALEKLKFGTIKNIMDLGCGFGFFTSSLKGKIRSDAQITGIDRIDNYRSLFLETCKSIGAEGIFYSSGAEIIKSLPSNSFDLILSSYSIYFFPELIPQIARILLPEGYLVIITHSTKHVPECIDLVKDSLIELKTPAPEKFPYEELIGRFDDADAFVKLSEHFNKVIVKEYKSSLVFQINMYEELKQYFEFKKPYYIPSNLKLTQPLFDKMMEKLKTHLTLFKQFTITKNDKIYISFEPVKNG